MTKKIFRFDIYRILSLWVVPFILLTFIALVFIVDRKSLQHMKAIELFFWPILLVLSVGVFAFLFFNHLSFASKTQIIFESEDIIIIQNKKTYKIKLSGIQKIVEYSIDNKYTSGKLPWGAIMKWEITTSTEQLYISSLTISKDNFKQHFKKEFTYTFSYLPTI